MHKLTFTMDSHNEIIILHLEANLLSLDYG